VKYLLSGAHLSECEKYRYMLFREWNVARTVGMGRAARMRKLKLVTFIGLNPSTADARKDDATIRRCVGFAHAWGYDGMIMLNLFAYRATDPRKLLEVTDPVGLKNDDWLKEYSRRADLVILAWGSFPLAQERAHTVTMRLHRWVDLYTLRTTASGAPAHPLRLPKTITPQLYLRKR
jgi:hypothetical protein